MFYCSLINREARRLTKSIIYDFLSSFITEDFVKGIARTLIWHLTIDGEKKDREREIERTFVDQTRLLARSRSTVFSHR